MSDKCERCGKFARTRPVQLTAPDVDGPDYLCAKCAAPRPSSGYPYPPLTDARKAETERLLNACIKSGHPSVTGLMDALNIPAATRTSEEADRG